jgi:hypothetical protein
MSHIYPRQYFSILLVDEKCSKLYYYIEQDRLDTLEMQKNLSNEEESSEVSDEFHFDDIHNRKPSSLINQVSI